MKYIGHLLILLLIMSSILPGLGSTVLACTQPDGVMGPSEPYRLWHTDSTYSFEGIKKRQLASNTLDYSAYVYIEDGQVHVFIATDDNTSGGASRDQFSIYFDVYPLGLGKEDFAYEIQTPTSTYGSAIKKTGPDWGCISRYGDLVAGQSPSGVRTYELVFPLSQLRPGSSHNYDTFRYMILMRNYGTVTHTAQLLVNYHPDGVKLDKPWNCPSKWETVRLQGFLSQFGQYRILLSSEGSGKIVPNPLQSLYATGTNVQLTAVPDSGWVFSGWSGDASGSANPLTLTVDRDKHIDAIFLPVAVHTYSLSTSVQGQGMVTGSQMCREGAVVTVAATPNPGWHFVGWLGDASGSVNPLDVVMNRDMNLVALFEQDSYRLNVDVSGSGDVNSSPVSQSYLSGSSVVLTAVPDIGWFFKGWSGNCTGDANPLTVSMSGEVSLKASFEKRQYSLSVASQGGSIRVDPYKITYNYGDLVHLTGVPLENYTFTGWGGDAAGSVNPATIIMDGNKTVSASFHRTKYLLTINSNGENLIDVVGDTYRYSGQPTVFQHVFDSNESVTVIGYSNYHFLFDHWEGDCSSSDNRLNVVMNSDVTLTGCYRPTSSIPVRITVICHGDGWVENANTTWSLFDHVSLRASPSSGWAFDSWVQDGGEVETNSGSQLSLFLVGNVTVDAYFTANAGAKLFLDPHVLRGPPPDIGDEVTYTLKVSNVVDLWCWKVSLQWDPRILEFERVKEGPTLNSTGPTIFLYTPTSGPWYRPGNMTEIVDAALLNTSFSGDGELAFFTFRVIGYGNASIGLTDTWLRTPANSFNWHRDIPHRIENAVFTLPAPPPHPPIAMISLPSGGSYYYGTMLNATATTLPGYDNLPVANATINPVTTYHWEVDVGDDGSVDYTCATPYLEYLLEDTGPVRITLSVTAPDRVAPSSIGYSPTATVSRLIHVYSEPVLANVDVYTGRGGKFKGQPSDPYGPQELVTLYANVTYNGVGVANKDVSFEIRDVGNRTVGYRTARSDEDGVASASFRLPWPDEAPESVFGDWRVVATVDISEVRVSDSVCFTFDYLVKIKSVELENQGGVSSLSFARGTSVRSLVTLRNIRSVDMPVVVALTVCDESSVAINAGYISILVPAGASTVVVLDLGVPSYSFVGVGRVYVNAFSALPRSLGIPYCPEGSKNLVIRE